MRIKQGRYLDWEEYVEKNSQDFYSFGVVKYTRQWADLMEAYMEDGHELEAIAESTSHHANTDGITGFMYGAAVWTLSEFWIHGERLRLWHNHTTQLSNEGDFANVVGGVLNPALLNVSPKHD